MRWAARIVFGVGAWAACVALYVPNPPARSYEEVRQVPHQLHAGALLPGNPVVQGVEAASWMMSTEISLHVAPLVPEPRGRVRLRVVGPDGELQDEVVAAADSVGADGWLTFEDVGTSAAPGERLRLEFEALDDPVPLSPHLRFRGRVQPEVPWGDRHLTGLSHERRIEPRHPDLAGIAVAFGALDRSAGPATVTLLDEGGDVVARARTGGDGRTQNGYVPFVFPPLEAARRQPFTLRVEHADGAQVVGRADGPTYMTLHRRSEGRDSPMIGTVLADERREDLDLVVRIRGPFRHRSHLGQRAWWVGGLLALAMFALWRMNRALEAADAAE